MEREKKQRERKVTTRIVQKAQRVQRVHKYQKELTSQPNQIQHRGLLNIQPRHWHIPQQRLAALAQLLNTVTTRRLILLAVRHLNAHRILPTTLLNIQPRHRLIPQRRPEALTPQMDKAPTPPSILPLTRRPILPWHPLEVHRLWYLFSRHLVQLGYYLFRQRKLRVLGLLRRLYLTNQLLHLHFILLAPHFPYLYHFVPNYLSLSLVFRQLQMFMGL